MKIGELNRRVEVLEQVEDRDTFGAVKTDWIVTGRVWANISPKTANEFFDNNQIKTSQKVVIVMRFYAGITVKHRIKYKDKLYEIISVIDKDTRHEKTILECKEII